MTLLELAILNQIDRNLVTDGVPGWPGTTAERVLPER